MTALSAVTLYAATPVLAGTAVLPSNGETTYATHYAGRAVGTEYLGDGASESLVELTGVSRNAVGQPAFDAMNAHCLMLSAIIGGKPRRYGACTQTDHDGDHAFTSFDGAAFKLIGGTGKYKGISGSGLLFGHAGAFARARAIRIRDGERHDLDDSTSAANCGEIDRPVRPRKHQFNIHT